MADAPPVKPRGQVDKDLLQKLINRGKVDITRTCDTDYIDRIWHKYFRPRNSHNFRRNFRSYARSFACDLEDHLSDIVESIEEVYYFVDFIAFILYCI